MSSPAAPVSPLLVRTLADLRGDLSRARARGERIGFVPTMGALHDGHLALMREARNHADRVVVSIFVNPTQFGPGEDFTRYPRDLEGDLVKCARAGAEVVFNPSDPRVLYALGEETRVHVGATAQHFEGAVRPTHFEGVATVCCKLFNVVGPCVAVLGRKDFQQLAVLRRMVCDLFLPVEIVGAAIVREADGLAMSSRNAYLSTDDRLRARAVSRGVASTVRAFERGERDVDALIAIARATIEASVDAIDYVAIADCATVTPLAHGARIAAPATAVLLVVARFGTTRLLDNVVLGEERSVVEIVDAFDRARVSQS